MTVIEVFADVACPFAHVGLRRFVDLRAERGRPDVMLHVRAWPLEVLNHEPHDPHHVAEEVDDIRGQAAPTLFRDFSEAAFPTSTMPALSLASAAYRKDVATGEAVSLELRDLLFERGVDVADLGVLERLAGQHQLDHVELHDDAAVLADHAAGVARGVTGSPHFFTAAGDFFCPALDVRRDGVGRLHVSADPEAFDRFVEACFS